MSRQRVLIAPILHDEPKGSRVAPNLFTTLDKVERFCHVIEDDSKRGIPTEKK